MGEIRVGWYQKGVPNVNTKFNPVWIFGNIRFNISCRLSVCAHVVISGQHLLKPESSQVSFCAWRGTVSVCANVTFEDSAFIGKSLINVFWRWGLFFYDNLKKNRERKLSLAVSCGLQKYSFYIGCLRPSVPPHHRGSLLESEQCKQKIKLHLRTIFLLSLKHL